MSDDLRACLDRGDHAGAFAQLYAAHRDDVAAFVRRRVAPAEVDDVCQEVWSAARAALPRFRLDCRPGVWLRAIARHKLVDARRRRGPMLDADDSEVLAQAIGAAPSTPTSRLARRERAAAVQRALAALDDDDRELIVLRFFEGLSPAEIAIVLGGATAANTLSQRIVRICKRLRRELEAIR